MSGNHDQVIAKILEAWEEARNSGEELSIADLCADRPDLLDEVRKRIGLLLAVDDIASIEDTADQLPVPEFIGDYRVVKELGHGAGATVYLCEQETPKRFVAIKLFESRGAIRRKRFEREAHILGSFEHPGIARIFDFGRTDERAPYLVMEYVDGQTLEDFAKQHELSERQKLRLLSSVLEAVAHAHRHGVVHRDLKPTNILVKQDGSTKIIDFGIATFTDASIDRLTSQAELGELLGTLPFMAPEQVESLAVDFRADIYSVGVRRILVNFKNASNCDERLAGTRSNFGSEDKRSAVTLCCC